MLGVEGQMQVLCRLGAERSRPKRMIWPLQLVGREEADLGDLRV
jgi:hypothetical protein